MKGKGSRGMPKKAMMRPGDMVNTGAKKRMMARDFQQKKEWVRVAKLEDDLAAKGSTKAVEAGRAPGGMGPTGFQEGSKYIWSLVRGEGYYGEDGEEEVKVFATDGACRACKFPLTRGVWSGAQAGCDEQTLTCPACGTRYSLESGEPLDFLPGDNPVHWLAKVANEKNGPQRLAVLPTRVSKSGAVYVRLPENTIID